MKVVRRFQTKEVAESLLNGDVVAFPTETVFGLAVVYDNIYAFRRLVDVKKRNPDKPFALMLADVEDIEKYCFLSDNAKKVVEKFMPGEITILVNAKPLPEHVTLGTNVIGIRIPNDEYVRSLIRKVGKPLLVTSANMSGFPPLTDYKEVEKVFAKEDVSYLVMGECVSETPSTVVDIRDNITVLRQGKITKEEIEESIK